MYIEICRHRVPNAWRHLTPVGEVQEAALRDPVELAKHNMKLRRGWKITAAMLGDDAALEQEHQASPSARKLRSLAAASASSCFLTKFTLVACILRKQA